MQFVSHWKIISQDINYSEFIIVHLCDPQD